MKRCCKLPRTWVACLLMVVACACMVPVAAADPVADMDATLARVDGIRSTHHAAFVQQLAQLRLQAASMTPEQQWQLRYMDAWEDMFEGNYAKSEIALHDLIDNSHDPALATKSSAVLLSILGTNRRYEEAFALANRMVDSLESIDDPHLRTSVVTHLSQMFDLAGQTELAVRYARMAERDQPAGDNRCYTRSFLVTALNNAKQLTADGPDLLGAIDLCRASGDLAVTNALRLTQGELFLSERRPAELLRLLDALAPDLQTSGLYIHKVSAQVLRASAYHALGDDDNAWAAATSAVAMGEKEGPRMLMKDAYEILYGIARKRGDTATALMNYEKFVSQDRDNFSDITARNLAYELSQQHAVEQKLEAEKLAKQNATLRLQKALDVKAVETSRLYVVLLSVVVISIGLMLVRTKRSQLRFKRLSSYDGLTSVLNHQHFMADTEKALASLRRKQAGVCLVCIDLDHFKRVNDAHGHAVGDIVLTRTVALIRQQLRAIDIIGRLGGEEFAVLLPGCSLPQGAAIAERIRIAIEASPVVEGDAFIAFTASLGVASNGASGYELTDLYRDADAALYRAKNAGRNQVVTDDIGDHATSLPLLVPAHHGTA